MKHCIIILSLLYFSIATKGQEKIAIDTDNDGTYIVNQILEEMNADGIDTESLQEEAANLISLTEDKLDLNTVTFEELGQLFFLKEYQRDNIIYQRERFGPYYSELELLTIPGISAGDAERILAFAQIKPQTAKAEKTRKSKFTLLARVQRTYPNANGFTAKNDTTDAPFLGSPYKTLVRIKGNVKSFLGYGLIAESDAGEPMFSHGISTFDFLSGYISITPQKKALRSVILGNYTARFGQGLGLWTGASYDVSSVQSSVTKYGNRLKPSTSANEYDYLRGIAIELGTESTKIDAFYSETDNDASLLLDNDSAYYTTTIQTSGLHRTATEIKNRNTLQQRLYGAVFTHDNTKHHISVGYNQWHSSIKIDGKGELYRLFTPRESTIGTVHADYRYYIKKVMLYGEGIYQTTQAIAGVQGIDIELGNNTLTIAYRYFDKKYYNHCQHPFSRATHPGGESGAYIGIQITPLSDTDVLANVNVFRNKWLQYLKPSPTNGYKARVNITHKINDTNDIALRIRHEKYEESFIRDRTVVAPTTRNDYRLTWTSKPNEHLRFTTTVETTYYGQTDYHSKGFWGSELMTITLKKATCSILLAHFDTDDYNSRVYHSLPDVASSMSIPAFSGKGAITVANIKWTPSKHFDFWIWGGRTKYYDRKTIGTSHNEVDSSKKTEIKVQLRIRV